jgi:hypothetical protein
VGGHVLAHACKTGDLADAWYDEIQTQQASPGEKHSALRIYQVVAHVCVLFYYWSVFWVLLRR